MAYTPPYRNPSPLTYAQGVERLKKLFEKWGVGFEDYQLDCAVEGAAARNHPSYRDDTVRLRYRHPASKAVVEMSLGSQATAAKNLSALVITLEDIYMQERRGLGGIAAAHYLALAAPAMKRDPYEVLGVRPDADLDTIEIMYRGLAVRRHPDKEGGSTEAMKELNEAYEEAKRRLA